MSRYQIYLKSKHWRERRLQAIKDVGSACQICGSEVELQVHHLNYDNLGHEEDNDLIVACEVCHKKHHGGYYILGLSNLFKALWENCSVVSGKKDLGW